MVSTQQKIIASAQRRKATQAAHSTANAFNQKQSLFARRSEEHRVREETGSGDAPSAFDAAKGRSANRGGASNARLGGRVSSRQGKFQLDATAAPTEEDSVARELGALLGSQAPAARPRDNDMTELEPDNKRQRKEKFEDVITGTRRTRTQLQEERDVRNQQTNQLDSEFSEVMQLLQKRDKRQEEIDDFQRLGRPDVRQLLAEHAQQRTALTGRKFTLGADGALVRPADSAAGAAEQPAAAVQRSPAQLPAATPKLPVSAVPMKAAAGGGVDDDFDAMLGAFRSDVKRAHAVDRVLLPEEEAAREVQIQLMAADRELRPLDDRARDRTRGEWIAAGGDNAYMMDEEEEFAGQSAPLGREGQRQSHAVDEVLGRMEALCAAPPEDAEERNAALSDIASQLWHAAVKQKKHAEESFKLILIDCQRFIYKGRPLSRFHRLALYLATKLFPTTDFRHPVMTPLMILLSSLCIQSKLTSLQNCRHALWYAGALLHVLSASKRYASEPVAVALNVIALQLPKAAMLPTTHGTARGAFPVMERDAGAILSLPSGSKCDQPSPISFFEDDVKDSPQARLDTLAAAYRLLANAAELYGDSPSFGCIFETSFVTSFHRIVKTTKLNPTVEALHTKTVERVAMLAAETAMNRTPLAMRTFRPRPLRQYEPLLGDDTPDERKERQILKKEHSADHKRVMRTLTAEARVEQRNREGEHAAVEARRRAKLTTIMAELQQQQYIMKTSDQLKTKAGSRKREAANVVPQGGKRGGGGGGDDE
jgi:hypothetical protein